MINPNNIVTNSHNNVNLPSFGKGLLLLEPFLLILMIYRFWFPIEIRYAYLGLLVGIPIFMVIRLLTYGRLFTRFPLDVWLIAFILLSILNLYLSPFTAANPISRLYLLGRPLLGMALCVYFVEYVRRYKRLDGLLLASLVLTLLIGIMALFSSNWTSKSDQLRFMLDLVLRYDKFDGANGGFNVNEIAGGLVWIVPLCAGLLNWQGKRPIDRFIRWGFRVAFVVSSIALFLGQSRFAIAGTLLALALAVPLVIRHVRGRMIAWTSIVVIIILEVMIVRNVFTPPGQATLSERDETSVNVRFDIWASALKIIEQHPLTGVGMNMFREKVVRNQYPVPTFEQPVLPHAHNELLQIATDLGLPGVALFISWYGVVFYSLFRAYRRGKNNVKSVAVGVAAGLIAHALFGLGDAVALWDRFAFVFWWLLALGSATYWIAIYNTNVDFLEQFLIVGQHTVWYS